MSDTNVEDVKKQESLHDPDPKDDVGSDKNSVDDKKDLNEHKNDGNSMPSSHQEEEVIKKKYGGLIPKKPPLISKDHERAYFDSADWALGKEHKSLKDHSKHSAQSCSQHNSMPVQGAQLMLQQMILKLMATIIMPLQRTRVLLKMLPMITVVLLRTKAAITSYVF
ncbi:hypothetical protein TanjilG_08656 [Lupinus angustifolius]|uniref:Endosulphine n=1 Tax=Lupinus angustifolius TaxID=3871 RepID=A0A4P1R8B8_LUPAN|nr:hypothetical protein TanjilG_08656 [Lupinus angustifolius]